MSSYPQSDNDPPYVTTVDVDGHPYNVSLDIRHDGVEFVGHLWFTDEDWEDDGVVDHGVLPGRSIEEVIAHAQTLSAPELVQRYRRAWAHKRRYHGLRRTTSEVLNGIRHLNRVATSMRAGLLDIDEAAMEIDGTERRLHELVDQLRAVAGVES